MKKFIIILLFLFSNNIIGQIHFVDEEYFIINIVNDPYSSYKEKGLYNGFELGVVSYGKLIKAGLHNFPVLNGGWSRLNGTFAFIVEPDYFLTTTTFSGGLNLGYINRSKYLYPYYGFEIEAVKRFNNVAIGFRSNLDRRTDFKYWGGEPKWRYSGQIILQFKF